MSGTTPNYGFYYYDDGDTGTTFLTFRQNIAGNSGNPDLIDAEFLRVDGLIDALEQRQSVIHVDLTGDGNQYAGAASGVTEYTDGMTILVTVSPTNLAGGVQFDIEEVGYKSVKKVNYAGSLVALAAGDLVANHYYFFIYSVATTEFILASPAVADQIAVFGDTGCFLRTSANKTIENSAITFDTTVTLGTSDTKIPSQKAVKTYADSLLANITPSPLGVTGNAGDTGIASRANHVHILPTLDGLNAPTDITTLNATTSLHGLVPKAVDPGTGVANQVHYVGLEYTETGYANKDLFDATLPAAVSGTSTTGTAGTVKTVARRDHIHGRPDTMAGVTLTSPVITGYNETKVTQTISTSYTIDPTVATIFNLTIPGTSGNNGIVIPTAASTPGRSYSLIVNYGGNENAPVFSGGTIRWSGALAPTPTVVTGKADIYVFLSDGTSIFGTDGGRGY